MHHLHKMTLANVQAAFAGESQAHMRYAIFADKAESEGFANVARLFRAISFAERVHASNHLTAMGGLGKSEENLAEAIGGETYEVEEMYPAFRAVAELQDEKLAQKFMEWALEAERVHADMYGAAREAVLGGKDAEVGEIHICEKCGWTVEGEPPDRCPVCKASRDKFRKF